MRHQRFRHDAMRDTVWIGKGSGQFWPLLVLALLAAAAAPLFLG